MSEWRVSIQRDGLTLWTTWWWCVVDQKQTYIVGYGRALTEKRARKAAQNAILYDRGPPLPNIPPIEVWTDEQMDPSDRRTAL